jgi:hypothetical protein
MVAHGARDADAAGCRRPLQPCGDVDAVAIMSPLSAITSPRLTPMRNLRRRSSARSRSRSAIAYCISPAQRTASTTLANSTSRQSPAFLTMRPCCTRTLGRSVRRDPPGRARGCLPHPHRSGANTPPHRRLGSRRDGGSRPWPGQDPLAEEIEWTQTISRPVPRDIAAGGSVNPRLAKRAAISYSLIEWQTSGRIVEH